MEASACWHIHTHLLNSATEPGTGRLFLIRSLPQAHKQTPLFDVCFVCTEPTLTRQCLVPACSACVNPFELSWSSTKLFVGENGLTVWVQSIPAGVDGCISVWNPRLMSSPDDSNSAIVTEGNISLVDSLKKQRQFPPGEGLCGCISWMYYWSIHPLPLQTKKARGYHFVFRPEINKWIHQCSVPLFTFDLKKKKSSLQIAHCLWARTPTGDSSAARGKKGW